MADAAEPEEGAELVERGSFRIDRRRALEKLSQYQLGNRAHFLLPWVRLAALSGASEVGLKRFELGLLLEFDGRPLEAGVLKNPYMALLEEGLEDEARGRCLAYGLLGALRAGAVSVVAESGSGAKRLRLCVSDLTKEDSVPDDSDEGRTMIWVHWNDAGQVEARCGAAFAALSERCALLKTALRMDGVLHASRPAPADAPFLRLDETTAPEALRPRLGTGRVRGFIKPLHGTRDSDGYLYSHGVLAEAIRFPATLAPVEVHLESDDFRLNAGLSGVVRDGSSEPALHLMDLSPQSLVAHLCAQRKALPKPLHPLRPDSPGQTAQETMTVLRMNLAGKGGPLRRLQRWSAKPGVSGPRAREWMSEGLVLAWLRGVASRALRDPEEDKGRLAGPLWDTPLYISTQGKPLTPRAIRKQAGARGRLVATLRCEEAPEGTDWPWVDSPEDPCLKRILPAGAELEVRYADSWADRKAARAHALLLARARRRLGLE
ncbi:MAG: hypothetical protein HY928_10775 [Elusimicrobia bacterium]|nr:hypothetical protein [Elusimicrobiota bacterium]